MQASRLVRRQPRAAPADLCSAFCSLYIAARGLNTSAIHRAATGSNNATPNPMHSAPPGTTKRDDKAAAQLQRAAPIPSPMTSAAPGVSLTAAERLRDAEAAKVAKDDMEQQRKDMLERRQPGGLAKNSLFADAEEERQAQEKIKSEETSAEEENVVRDIQSLAQRNKETMEYRLNPRPNARARWVRKMVIRDVRRRGRITREMYIARTERTHTAKSHFFKTSVKKLAPLARQIAGKSIDEAIVQMRFSKKKAAMDVLKHLINARNEAIVVRGMGLTDTEVDSEKRAKSAEPVRHDVASLIRTAVSRSGEPVLDTSTDLTEKVDIEITNPANTPPLSIQKPDKSLKKGFAPDPKDIYIAQAWVNRGRYLAKPSPRARGRMDVLRPPFTGMSVMLKEEQTRSREKAEKEAKAIKKRLTGKIWTQLPDRPITRQSQYVLW